MLSLEAQLATKRFRISERKGYVTEIAGADIPECTVSSAWGPLNGLAVGEAVIDEDGDIWERIA